MKKNYKKLYKIIKLKDLQVIKLFILGKGLRLNGREYNPLQDHTSIMEEENN